MHHAVKNQRVSVQGLVKKPQLDYVSHRGAVWKMGFRAISPLHSSFLPAQSQ